MYKLIELAERVARLEAWANDFSCRAEHADAPIFTTKAWDTEQERRAAALRARASQEGTASRTPSANREVVEAKEWEAATGVLRSFLVARGAPAGIREDDARKVVQEIVALSPLDREVVEAALDEAMRRYPGSRDGLAWFAAASGLRAGEITQEVRDWANAAIRRDALDDADDDDLQAWIESK